MLKINTLMNIDIHKTILFLLTTALFMGKANAQQTQGQTAESIHDNLVTNIFLDAKKEALKGNTKKAITLFINCLDKNPNHAPSMFELSQIYFDTKDFAKAEDFAKNAVQVDSANKWYKIFLAQVYAKEGKNREYLEISNQLVKKDPDDPEYLYNAASDFIMKNELENALGMYNKLEDKIGVNEEVTMQKFRIYVFQKKYDEAAAEIDKLISKEPDLQNKYLATVAEMYMKNDLPDKAHPYYEKLLKNSPSDPYINITLADYYRQKKELKKAIVYLKNGFGNPNLDADTKFNIFLNYYSDKALPFQPDDISDITDIIVKTHPDYAKGFALRGDFFLDQKKYAEAKEFYLKSIALDSTNYKVWERLLNTEAVGGDHVALHRDSKRALDLFPQYPTPAFFYGGTLMEQKKYAEAIHIYETAAPAFSQNLPIKAQIYANIAECYYQLGKKDTAFIYFDKSLVIEPDNSFVLNNYAYYLVLQQKDLEKAEKMAEKAVALDPVNTANMDTYGWVLFNKGKYEEALKWIKKAVAAAKRDDADVLEHLGDVYYKLGKEKKALKYWEKASKLYPASLSLQQKVKTGKLE